MTGTFGGRQGRRPTNSARTGASGADVAGAGFQFAAILVLSSFAGVWADRKLGTSPWLVIAFVFLGAAAAFFSLYHKLMKGKHLDDRNKPSNRPVDTE